MGISNIERLQTTDRGGLEDLRGSQDFEDIVYVIYACPDFMKRYEQKHDSELKNYIREQFHAFAARPNIMEEIECALPMGEKGRADLLLDIFAKIA